MGAALEILKMLNPRAAVVQQLRCAYWNLLAIPHDVETRERIQPALACVRDEIARLSHTDPETVQDTEEALRTRDFSKLQGLRNG